jgi:hypothetical protein
VDVEIHEFIVQGSCVHSFLVFIGAEESTTLKGLAYRGRPYAPVWRLKISVSLLLMRVVNHAHVASRFPHNDSGFRVTNFLRDWSSKSFSKRCGSEI